MPNRFPPPTLFDVSRAGFGLLLAVLFLVLGGWFQHYHGWPVYRNLHIEASDIRNSEGLGHSVRVPKEFEQSHRRMEHRSQMRENGKSTGPAAESVSEVRRDGGGLHVINDNGSLWFSTPDGSDPRSNGRKYVVRLPRNLPAWYFVWVGGLAALGGLLWLSPVIARQWPSGTNRLRNGLQKQFGGGRWIRALGWALLFAGSFWHYTRHNDFTYHYHPDEPKKAFFITHKRVHFNHPQLLTTTSRLVHWMGGSGATPQEAAEIGRHVSAAFAAGTVVLLAWAAVTLAGPAALAIVPFLWFHPGLHEASRYMKEDTALLLGLGAATAAAVLYSRHPGRGTALLAGLAAGLACSGKYIGLLAVPLVLLSVGLAAHAHQRNGQISPGAWKSLVLAALATAVTFALINFDAIRQWEIWKDDLNREVDTFGPTRRDHSIQVPNAWFARYLWVRLPLALWILIPVAFWGWVKRPQFRVTEWLVPVGFAVIYLGFLCFSIYPYPRYALPVEVLLVWVAACGFGFLAGSPATWGRAAWPIPAARMAVAVLLLSLISLPWITECIRFNSCLLNDTRDALYKFIRDDVRAEAVIAQSNDMRLPFRDRHLPDHHAMLPQTIHTRPSIAEFNGLENLRSLGVTHLAVSPYSLPDSWFAEGSNLTMEEKLASLGRVVWRSQGPHGGLVALEVILLELMDTDER